MYGESALRTNHESVIVHTKAARAAGPRCVHVAGGRHKGDEAPAVMHKYLTL